MFRVSVVFLCVLLVWVLEIIAQHTIILSSGEASHPVVAATCANATPTLDYFSRPVGQHWNCKDAYACSQSMTIATRCRAGLSFDVEKQLCQWESLVDNCHQREKIIRSRPGLEPCLIRGTIIEGLTCGDDTCIEKHLFCDGKVDCPDNSDEHLCAVINDPNRAPPCHTIVCNPPNCRCDDSFPFDKEELPQMVVITFEDSVHKNNIQDILDLLEAGVKSPNGCSPKATFFVSHEYTDYSIVNALANAGHDIASHSITHDPSGLYWNKANRTTWTAEMTGQRYYLEHFADIKGFVLGGRSPLFRLGGNPQMDAMFSSSFVYDSSMVALALEEAPVWPYTMDSQAPHKCSSVERHCRTRSYPGFWEIPINELTRGEGSPSCALLPLCYPTDEEDLVRILTNSFLRHFHTNRAPFGLHLNPAWFKTDESLVGSLINWMQLIKSLYPDEVYFVSNSQLLKWLENPKPISQLENFEAFQTRCNEAIDIEASATNNCKSCTLYKGRERRQFSTCSGDCPSVYPWL